jgi:hypothetical protein
VFVDRPHRYRTTPPCEPELQLTTNPEIGIPFGRAASIRPAPLSHYHPFDPSTKWLRHGTLRIWLIIGTMWPPGHGDAWQRHSGQAIVP